jgi:hypothetical protein
MTGEFKLYILFGLIIFARFFLIKLVICNICSQNNIHLFTVLLKIQWIDHNALRIRDGVAIDRKINSCITFLSQKYYPSNRPTAPSP